MILVGYDALERIALPRGAWGHSLSTAHRDGRRKPVGRPPLREESRFQSGSATAPGGRGVHRLAPGCRHKEEARGYFLRSWWPLRRAATTDASEVAGRQGVGGAHEVDAKLNSLNGTAARNE